MADQEQAANIVEGQSVTARFVPDNTQPAPRFYSNFCVVRHTPFDFNIEFCELAALHEDEQEELVKAPEKIIRAPVRVEVVLPPKLIPAVIEALQVNYKRFLEHYGGSEEEIQDVDV